MIKKLLVLLVVFSSIFNAPSFSKGNNAFNNRWKVIKDKSAESRGYEGVILNIKVMDSKVSMVREFGKTRRMSDSMVISTDGKPNKIKITSRSLQNASYMALTMPIGEYKTVKANWIDNGNTLKVEENFEVCSSQGNAEIILTHLYKLDPDKEELVYTMSRNTRTSGSEMKLIFKPENKNNAYFMKLDDEWSIEGKLPPQAFLISLQGVVNSNKPQLYFIYGEKWDYRFTQPVSDFLKDKHSYTFDELKTVQDAVNTFKDQVKGYVVWDKNVRTSLIVAFTACGIESAVAVTEDMIPMMEKAGIKMVEDFRGKFTGKTDLEIFTWAYDKYWNKCSRDFIIWMGGEHGNIMKPGVADYGIMKKAFFTDASTSERDKEEYAFAKKLMSEQKTMSMVMGWHSYKKDRESDFTTLASSFALRIDGLHTLPNISFVSQVPVTKGFKYKNNHNIIPGKEYIPEKKVYITCVQTDCLGLGAWTRPGRGSMPYTWEVTMNWQWLAPAMLEYFYSQATPNDYFIGSLSGPGYMYPKAIPEKYLPEVISKAKELMDILDLNSFEIMDHSARGFGGSNADIPKNIVDAYYKGMPNAIGFLNGYGPARTFTSREGRPFLSFDYYLAEGRSEEDAANDLRELAKVNSQRPYFMVVHVREWSDISKVKSILDMLGKDFEVIPTDIFLKMAGKNPTFKEFYTLPK